MIDEICRSIICIYKGQNERLQVSVLSTVEDLKLEIYRLFNIRPSKQIISGWTVAPESDDSSLESCTMEGNILLVVNSERRVDDDVGDTYAGEDAETEATWRFICNFLNKAGNCSDFFRCNVWLPQSCKLKDAISQACSTSLEERRVLILYLHKEGDAFSTMLCDSLQKAEVLDLLNRNMLFLGWDIDQPELHSALKTALSDCGNMLTHVVETITFQSSLALFLVPYNNTVQVLSCLKGDISYSNLLITLETVGNALITEIEHEKSLEQLQRRSGSKNDFGSLQYQQHMADMLGDRDYDIIEYAGLDQLRAKVAYSLLGPPQTENNSYNSKQQKLIDSTYKKILKCSNEICKYKDTVEISFIYNCTEPLPKEKLKRAKKLEDYNPNTDINPRPIFVLRKCRGSADPCRVFIDDIGRTYSTWNQYKTCNKLHKCEMILPLNGRYEFGDNGEVLLEKHLSPACGMDVVALQCADHVSTAGGLISGGIFLTAAIPAIAVAPIALVTAGAVGLGVGVYAIGRSAHTLYNRGKHRESLSFANSEARGAYLNIVAGSLGFVGAGATMVVSQLAARGVNIGRGAAAAVDAISFINIGAGGANMINSGYDVFDQWYNESQTPSMLTIVQLSSSVLFFGNSVYNFKNCSAIVEKTQAKLLQDHHESLRSNRHRKTFTKLMKETIRQNDGNEVRGRAEVISAIRNFRNKDEVYAVLTRSKDTLNKNGIKFTATEGKITLNGIKIDINDFANMNRKDASAFLSDLSSAQTTPAESALTRNIVYDAFRNTSVIDVQNQVLPVIAMLIQTCLGACSSEIKQKVIEAAVEILDKLTEFEGTNSWIPDETKYYKIIEVTIRFFATKAEELQREYEDWKRTGDDRLYNPLFKYVDVALVRNAVHFFEIIVRSCFCGKKMKREELKLLVERTYNWLAKQIYAKEERNERDGRRQIHSAGLRSKEVPCSQCGGHYYTWK